MVILYTILYSPALIEQYFSADIFTLRFTIFVFTLDIMGYALLALGWLKQNNITESEYRKQVISGIALIGWVIVSLYARLNFMIRDVTTVRIIGLHGFGYAMLTLSALLLFISGLTGINNRYFAYTTVNFVCGLALLGYYSSNEMVKIFFAIGVVFKIFFVPVLGVIAFSSIYTSNLGESHQTGRTPLSKEISII